MDILKSSWIKSRKEHNCDCCDELANYHETDFEEIYPQCGGIKKGQVYYKNTSVEDGSFNTFKSCKEAYDFMTKYKLWDNNY